MDEGPVRLKLFNKYPSSNFDTSTSSRRIFILFLGVIFLNVLQVETCAADELEQPNSKPMANDAAAADSTQSQPASANATSTSQQAPEGSPGFRVRLAPTNPESDELTKTRITPGTDSIGNYYLTLVPCPCPRGGGYGIQVLTTVPVSCRRDWEHWCDSLQSLLEECLSPLITTPTGLVYQLRVRRDRSVRVLILANTGTPEFTKIVKATIEGIQGARQLRFPGGVPVDQVYFTITTIRGLPFSTRRYSHGTRLPYPFQGTDLQCDNTWMKPAAATAGLRSEWNFAINQDAAAGDGPALEYFYNRGCSRIKKFWRNQ